VEENDIDLSGARKISGPSITAEKVDEYGLGTVTKTETPIIMDNNVRPTQPDGFSNEGIGSGKIIKPTEAVGGYNTGEETGNVYPRSGAIKGGPNPGTTSREGEINCPESELVMIDSKMYTKKLLITKRKNIILHQFIKEIRKRNNYFLVLAFG
jgi:hypothetical protein